MLEVLPQRGNGRVTECPGYKEQFAESLATCSLGAVRLIRGERLAVPLLSSRGA